MMEKRFRACPLCEAICGLELRYENNQLTAIRGDLNDPFSRGHICPKGNAILDLESDPDRLRKPMRKVDGKWEESNWDEAFQDIAERLHAIQLQHGNSSVATYLGNPTVHHLSLLGYVPMLLRAIGSRNIFSASSVDQWPHQLVNWQMYGHQWLLPIPDLDHLDVLLILGANPMASNGSLMTAPDVATRLKAIAKRGDLIVIDPRRTETADIATTYTPIVPGTDFIFLLALLQALQSIGPAKVSCYGDGLKDFSAAMQLICELDLGLLLPQTRVDASTVESIATALYRAEHCAVYGRMGVSTQRHGTVSQYLIQLCNIYLGQLDQVGGCLPNEPVIPVTGVETSKGSRGRWHSRVRGLPEVSGELPVAVLREEIETEGPGQIHALLTIAGNPVLSTPEGDNLERALSSLSFQLAIDMYVNETTRHADWILPPASFLSEDHYDVIFNAFAIRRVARLNTPTQVNDSNAMPQWKILQGIVQALQRLRKEPEQTFPNPREWVEAGLAKGGTGLTLQHLLDAPNGLDLGPLGPSLLRRLETASGKIECAPPLLIELLQAAIDERHASRSEKFMVESSKQSPRGDALLLVGRRHVRSNNSWMHNAPRLIKGKARHQLWMHPSDMLSRGLCEGAKVRIESEVGVVETEALGTEAIMPGVVSLPHGFGHSGMAFGQTQAQSLAGVNVNRLTRANWLDTGTGNAGLSGTPVWISAIQSTSQNTDTHSKLPQEN